MHADEPHLLPNCCALRPSHRRQKNRAQSPPTQYDGNIQVLPRISLNQGPAEHACHDVDEHKNEKGICAYIGDHVRTRI